MFNMSLFGIVLILSCTLPSNLTSNETDKATLRKKLEWELIKNLEMDEGAGCLLPNINPFPKKVMYFKKDVKCPGLDWVRCYHSHCLVRPEILKSYADIKCYYRDILYDYDWSYYDISPPSLVVGSGVYVLSKSDQVVVNCEGNFKKQTVSWLGLVVGIRPIEQSISTNDDLKNNLNVLIFAFEALSKNGFIHYFPKSYKFMKKKMDMTFLNSYNVVGDGTSAALFPLMTGKTELELSDSSGSGIKFRQTIFHKMKQLGYRTAYYEDKQWTTFNDLPADHYIRPFVVENTKVSRLCVGDTLRFRLMVDITEQLLQLQEKVFGFTYVSDSTHDYNYGTSADTELFKFMNSLIRNERINDTMFIVMADHGPSYVPELRNTVMGKMEERLPLMAFYLPKNLLERYPEALENLENNADVLATPHDVYATVLDALGLKKYWNPYKVPGADLKRGLSLLEPIPETRSCSEAGITSHWCSCLTWYNLPDTDPMYTRTAETLVNHINILTAPVGFICSKRKLSSVHWVNIHSPRHSLLSFARPEDLKGYVKHIRIIKPEYIKKLQSEPVQYQIKITVSPGETVYMATMTYSTQNKTPSVIGVTDFVRVSPYQNEAHCISKAFPEFKSLCYCKNNSQLHLASYGNS